jgi:hypothetical protein
MNRVDELRGQAEQVYNQIEDTPDALTQRLNAIAERVDSEGFQWGPGVDENQFDMATANVKEGEDTFILKPGATKGDYYRMLASEGVHEGADTRDIQVLERLADRVDAGGTDDYWAAAKEIAEENGEEPPTKPSGFRSEVAAGVKKLGISGTQAEIANTVIGNTVDSFAKMSGLSPEQIWKELGISSFTKEALVSVQEGQVAVGRYGARAWGHNGALKLNINVKHPAALTHEISHWLTDVTEMLARKFPNNAAIQKQFQAIKEYVGWVKAQDNPSSEYYGLVRGQHEKMADALLKYLEEGVSPNAELKSFFERAKAYMIDLWDALINMHKVELTPGIREFFDRLIAGDQGFDYNYGEANMSARAGNIAALTPEDLKVPAAAVEEARKGFTLTESTKGNVTTVTKRVDRSDTVGILGEALHSPNIIAKYFPKFAPVFELARAARRTQDKLRTQWNHSIDKAFGGVGLFGQRKGGYAATKEQREELNELLYLGDFYGKTFTAEELRAEGYSDGAIKGYQHIRNVDAGILRRVNEHRKSVGLEAIVGLEGHMMHVFHSFRVYDSNGVHIQSFQTMKEASAFADTLASDARHITIKPVINDFSGQAQKDAVTVGDNQYQIIMNKLADVFALSAEDAREFGKGVIKRANKARFYGPAQQRTGFSGWSSDMEYAIRHQANLSARYIAMDTLKRNGRKYFEKAFGKFGNEYKGIAKYTKDYLNDVLGVPSKWEDAQNKMLERFGPIVARLSDRYADRPAVALGNAVSGLTASMKLGFLNLGSAILNMSALNGVGAATSYAQAVQAGAEYLRPTLTTKKLYAALGIDSDITMESASTYSGAKMYKKALSGVSTGAFQFFDGAARKIAAIAGYRDGLAKGMNERQAIDHAREIVDKTNFNYGVEDSPNIFRRSGPLGNVMLQFKKYPIKIMELGVNHLEGAQKAKFWAGQLVMSGLFGLPFTAVLKAVIKALFDDEDIEAEVKNLVASLGLPEPVARTLNYGIAANIGIDLGQRVGMGDIVPTRAQDFVGPGVGTIVDIVKSTTDWAQGETALVDEIGKLIPGIGNPMKAVFGGAADSYNPERNRDTYRTTGERILQATGLRPIGTSVRRDAIMIQREQQRDEQHAKQVAIDRYMDDPSPENRAELRRLKVNPAQVVRRKKMQPGDDYDRALRGARKREDRDALTGYVGALGVDQ